MPSSTRMLFKRVIGNDQMLRAAVVAAADVVGILLVKALDVEAFAVQIFNVGRIFDNQQKFSLGLAQTYGQSGLIELCEGSALVVGKFRIIGRVEEQEIVLRGLDVR